MQGDHLDDLGAVEMAQPQTQAGGPPPQPGSAMQWVGQPDIRPSLVWWKTFFPPTLHNMHHIFKEFVHDVYIQSITRKPNHPLDLQNGPLRVKAEWGDEKLQALEADTSQWWKLAVLGVLRVCMSRMGPPGGNYNFWPPAPAGPQASAGPPAPAGPPESDLAQGQARPAKPADERNDRRFKSRIVFRLGR
jgi:hypothetical protein